jgi:hypothetical protein
MKAGDHICIQSDGTWRHAIDVGDRTALHFSSPGGVQRSRLSELAPAGTKVEVVTHAERVYPPKLVVARAFSRYAEAAYGAMFADSEAFAMWCKTGRERTAPRTSPALGRGAADAPPTADAAAPNAIAGTAIDAVDAAMDVAKPVGRSARAMKAVVRAVAGGRARKAAAAPAISRREPKKRPAPAKRAAAPGRAKRTAAAAPASKRAGAVPRSGAATPAKKGARPAPAAKKAAGGATAPRAAAASRTMRPAAPGAKRAASKRAGVRKRS